MSVKFANNAFGTLNAGINNSATSITLSSGQGARFPTLASGEYFYATLIDTSNNLEVVKCTARSTDVLTVTRAQESTTAQAFAIGDRIELRVTAQGLDDAANPYDKDTSSTGSLALPVGTTAQQPTAADTEGHIRYDSDDNVVYYSDGTNWLKISSTIATLSSVTGTVYSGSASTLTLAGKGFQAANLTVNFTQSSDSIDEDVTVTPTSDTAATVTVPAAVYNNVTAGNVVSITVTNSDSVESAAVTKTATALPSGGTVTTYGNYRVHSFTTSGTFTVPTGTTLTADVLMVAGGGGGGSGYQGGGGGAGGMIASASQSISAGSKTVTVGGGGSGGPGNGGGNASSGSNTALTGFTTCIGGGRGGGQDVSSGNYDAQTGGSGGGGNHSSGISGKAGTSGQGNSGGNGYDPAPHGGGGGGGKGAAGGNATSTRGGHGGAGAGNDYRTGSSSNYAGGGGGSARSNVASNGGSGGGGAGGNGNGVAGSSLTGGGGGAGRGADYGGSNAGVGGNGGGGIVVIRYQL